MAMLTKCSKDPTHELIAGGKFCPVCGSQVSRSSCVCGTALNDWQNFCENCGKETERGEQERLAVVAMTRETKQRMGVSTEHADVLERNATEPTNFIEEE